MRRAISWLPAVAAVALAGCGGGTKHSPTASTPAGPAARVTSKSSKLGSILAEGPKRLSVYLFEADRGGASACSGACAKVWPPLTTTGSPVAAGAVRGGLLGTLKRSDGTLQVTYAGHPLYRYVKDRDDGDSYGQGLNQFGAGWYVLAPTGKKVDKS